MRAILINAKKRTVNEINITGDLASLKSSINCRTVAAPYELENGDTVWCDDEGLYVNKDFIELFEEYDPIAGDVLITGTTRDGDTTDCKTTSSDIHNRVMFYDMATLQLKYRLASS